MAAFMLRVHFFHGDLGPKRIRSQILEKIKQLFVEVPYPGNLVIEVAVVAFFLLLQTTEFCKYLGVGRSTAPTCANAEMLY